MAKTIIENPLKNYVPRHMRLVNDVEKYVYRPTISQPDDLPVVDAIGNVMHVERAYKEVPCKDVIGKNTNEMFKIAVKVKNGVPLQLCNLQLGKMYENSKIMEIAQKINNVSEYAALLEKQKNETKAYFDQFVEPSNAE